MRLSLVLPFLVVGFIKLPPRFRFVALLLSPVLGVELWSLPVLGLAYAPLFLLGIALAVYVEPKARPFWITGPLFVGGWMLNGVHFYVRYAPVTFQYVAGIGAAMMIVAAISSPTAHRILTAQPIRFLGDISYSLYLVHIPITLFVVSWMFPALASPVLCAGITWSASILIAFGFRRWVELPGMRLKWRQAAQHAAPQLATPVP
jgi:peptidoglycan/LPS O-acetylase OafA/YrhL